MKYIVNTTGLETLPVIHRSVSFDQAIDLLKNEKDSVILMAGKDHFKKLRSLSLSGELHLGLRKFSYHNLISIPYLRIHDNVLIFVDSLDSIPQSKVDLFVEGIFNPNTPEVPYDFYSLNETNYQEVVDRAIQFVEKETGLLGLDFESCGFPSDIGFFLTGIGLSSKTKGVYISLDVKDTESLPTLLSGLKETFVKNQKRFVVYNVAFESQATYFLFGVWLEFLDAMVAVHCVDSLMTLKLACRKHLLVDSWDDSIDRDFSLIKSYLSESPTEDSISYIDETDEDEKNNKVEITIKDRISMGQENEWALVNRVTLGDYCIKDCLYTLLLWEDVSPKSTELALETYLNNAYLGSRLKVTSFRIDQELRKRYAKEYEYVYFVSNLFLNKVLVLSEMAELDAQLPNSESDECMKELVVIKTLIDKGVLVYPYDKPFYLSILTETDIVPKEIREKIKPESVMRSKLAKKAIFDAYLDYTGLYELTDKYTDYMIIMSIQKLILKKELDTYQTLLNQYPLNGNYLVDLPEIGSTRNFQSPTQSAKFWMTFSKFIGLDQILDRYFWLDSRAYQGVEFKIFRSMIRPSRPNFVDSESGLNLSSIKSLIDFTDSLEVKNMIKIDPGFDSLYHGDSSLNFLNAKSKIEIFYLTFYAQELFNTSRKQLQTYIIGLDKRIYYEKDSNPYSQSKLDLMGDRLKSDWRVNQKDTKRWSAWIHPLPRISDTKRFYIPNDGCLFTYFDISQAEPRTIAYRGGEESFKDLYESGKDAYIEIAKMIYNVRDDDPNMGVYRSICKVCLLAWLYNVSDYTLVEFPQIKKLGTTIRDLKNARDKFFRNMPQLAKWKDELVVYSGKTNLAKTILGDYLPIRNGKYYTKSLNSIIQNFTAVALASGFHNSVRAVEQSGFYISPKSVIHDSITNEIKIEDLLEVSSIYHTQFRVWCKEKYQVDYKFDIDLHLNLRDSISFKYDLIDNIFLSGKKDQVDTIINGLKLKHDLEIIDRKDYVKDGVGDFSDLPKFLEDPMHFSRDNNLSSEMTDITLKIIRN